MDALRARLRPRDKDIKQAIELLDLEQGELSDLIRDGMRLKLAEKGVLGNATESHRRDSGQLALFVDTPEGQ